MKQVVAIDVRLIIVCGGVCSVVLAGLSGFVLLLFTGFCWRLAGVFFHLLFNEFRFFLNHLSLYVTGAFFNADQ